jgi:hypothetical protein
MSKGTKNGRYKHGFRAGYTEWRYGDIRVKKRQEPIFEAAQYQSVVERVTAILANWTSSPFQHEAACRQGLRRQLCLKGYSWGRADAEAARIVTAGLANIRAVRPTHDEGQPQYSVSTDYCLHCHSPLDDHSITMNHRFCSPECAKATILFRNYEVGYWADQIGRAAFASVQRAKHAPRACKQCGTSFRPVAEQSAQIYCSQTCVGLSQRTAPECACEECGKLFSRAVGTLRTAKFCSKRCADKAATRRVVHQTCTFCGSPFVAGSYAAKFCSTTCAVAGSKLGRGWEPKQLLPHVFDHFITVPVNARPPWLTPARFDEMIAA